MDTQKFSWPWKDTEEPSFNNTEESIPETDAQFPLKPGAAIRTFKHLLSNHEQGEILDFKEIWFIGPKAKKIDAAIWNEFNYGYDDERGDYNIVFEDHIGYRYEVMSFLGKGSFGQALKCFDHKLKEFVALKIIRNKKKFYY